MVAVHEHLYLADALVDAAGMVVVVVVAFLFFGAVEVDTQLSIFGGFDFLDVDIPEGAGVPDSAGVDALLLFEVTGVGELGCETEGWIVSITK